MAHETPPHWDRSMRERLRRGEAAALAELYDRFATLTYRIAQRVLDDEEATAQVTREVFARIWEAPEDFDPEDGTLRSWIAGETHRIAVDRLRRPNGREGGAPAAGGALEAQVQAASTAARADYIVTAMPAPLRDALHLTRFQRQDYRQMAERLGITQDEARRRLRLGLQLLSSAARYRPGTADAPLRGGAAPGEPGREEGP
ncbi:RNA polymerase sigma factor [Streptomyces hoynatensis]|uniref:Sigma-70 family RNA polymerase sigma factor n=1 Tax=Streptomyces hoynatensis TaxID=1141874 RepID=A0A3A9Z0W2_9ACTN|nr:sigma-70 family RNA polymerase sigma factor [Streptomyces hoynatensis]RKN41679.1 sigma-70 family RNA polymerase sigma factor [Streptomyces hoynatensis]